MRLDRTKNTIRNIFFGVINRCIRILFPFLIRTIIIYKLGLNYVGLNSLFTSILSILSLSELGFDTAVVFIMYRAVAQNDEKQIGTLLNFIRKAYLIVGTVILTAGLVITPFVKYLIKDSAEIPADINLYHIYIFFLLNTVVSYYFGAYRKCILNAYQRQDVINNIDSVIVVISFAVQAAVLLTTSNYYVYIYTLPVFTAVTNLLLIVASKKMYPNIRAEGNLKDSDKAEIKKLIAGTFLGKIGAAFSVSADSLVISSMLGLTLLSRYSNYAYIISAITGIMAIIYTSMQGGVGNSLQLDSVEKNYVDLNCFTFIYDWILGWTTFCLLYLLQPFIKLWIGNEGLLPFIVVVFLCLNYYFTLFDSMLGIFKLGLGIWWEDRFRTLIGGLANLTLNITSVFLLRRFGGDIALIGVVASTILSNLIIGTPWATYITFKQYFKGGLGEYVLKLVRNFLVTVCVCLVGYFAMNYLDRTLTIGGIPAFILRLVICLILPNILYFLVYMKTEDFKYAKSYIMARLKKVK